MVDPKNNSESSKELVEALKTDYDEEIVEDSKSSNGLGFNLKKVLLIFILIVVLLIITLWLLSINSKEKTTDYSKYEKNMISAAKDYYKVNDKELPADNSNSEVTLDKLIELKYMEDYSALKSCTGSVTVENKSGSYSYSSYLDCGDSYNSKVLFKEVTNSKNIVTSDAGLYRMNGEYVYRGEKVNNYVSFGGRIWRIVKIDGNNDIVLILDKFFDSINVWDDRYNEASGYNTGYNNYDKSRVKDYLEKMYESLKTEEYKDSFLLTRQATKKIVNYKLCIGKVGYNNAVNNNSYECSQVVENTKIGLLTISDYMNASIDPNCKLPSSKSCQNYNYLSIKEGDWWLATANSDNTHEAYIVRSSGKIESIEANSYEDIRPVIHLKESTTYKSGNGTQTKPYVIE